MTINTKEIREATGVYVYPADLQFKLIEAENIILKLCDRIDELEEKIKWLEGLGVPIKESLTQTVDDLTEKLKVAEEVLERLAKLGSGDRFKNSIKNEITQETLVKIRGE